MDDLDRLRFIHDIYVMNNVDSVDKFSQRQGVERIPIRTKVLVSIHAFCLMPNHYHMLISERVEFGLSQFLKRLNGGYSQYFNKRHGRNGALFQGKTKKILIERDAHFMYIPHYIHLNPLDMKFPKWRQGELEDTNSAFDYLMKYRWSSLLDYCNKKNFPSVTYRNELESIYDRGSKGYQGSLKDIMKDKTSLLFSDYIE